MEGRIYRIIDNTNGNIYYGSTIKKINIRLTEHKAGYKRYLEGKGNYSTSFGIMKNNNYNIELVEEIDFETKYDLYNRERYYIENNICVNKHIPNRTMKEYSKEYNKEYGKKIREKTKEYRKEYGKEYREKNKENRKEYYKNNLEKIKEYYKNNLEKIKEYRENNKEKIKEYRENNKEKIKEKQKEYRQNNKEKIKEKITCECGAIVSRKNLLAHKRTKKHLNKII